jgi:hypothetical protein
VIRVLCKEKKKKKKKKKKKNCVSLLTMNNSYGGGAPELAMSLAVEESAAKVTNIHNFGCNCIIYLFFPGV